MCNWKKNVGSYLLYYIKEGGITLYPKAIV